ncbi:MAG: type II toxin-antitoxin system HicB family antitoxin [Candidatus Anammoxibacter sp.]
MNNCVPFPDFPGCITAGNTIEDAKQMAIEALNFHVKGMLEDGKKIPVPSHLQHITSDPEYRECFAFIRIEVREAKPKTVRVNITIPENTLKHIDTYCKKKGHVRIGFFNPCRPKYHKLESIRVYSLKAGP